MPAEWRIDYWPVCDKYVFLSHCAEDRDELVVPVFRELERRGVIPWIDRHHWPIARKAIEVLREELLTCRHVVYFVTPAMLLQGRGWASAERAFTDTIQQRLVYGMELAHVELPLLFVLENDALLHRSVWRSLNEKWRVCPHHSPPWQPDHVHWSADRIEEVVRQGDQWALELAIRYQQDPALRRHLSHIDHEGELVLERNLVSRILGRSPPPLPQA